MSGPLPTPFASCQPPCRELVEMHGVLTELHSQISDPRRGVIADLGKLIVMHQAALAGQERSQKDLDAMRQMLQRLVDQHDALEGKVADQGNELAGAIARLDGLEEQQAQTASQVATIQQQLLTAVTGEYTAEGAARRETRSKLWGEVLRWAGPAVLAVAAALGGQPAVDALKSHLK